MQPFDALSIRAILKEARPLITNRKVDKVSQLSRDEVLITLRGKSGTTALFLSAQSVHGRMCLVHVNLTVKPKDSRERIDPAVDRYISKYGTGAAPNFCLLLRKHLAGATLIAAEQPLGERIVDLVFSCTDEVGTASIKVLTAEIMGRHSNLIFWDKASGKIIAASHNVTKDMSRQREIGPNLRYERPPSQERPSLYTITPEAFKTLFKAFQEKGILLKAQKESGSTEPSEVPVTVEQWIIATFTGAGRHLCEELVLAAQLPSETVKVATIDDAADKLWQLIEKVKDAEQYKPFMLKDLSRYSILGLYPGKEAESKSFPSVNDLIEEYFRACELQEQLNQLRDRLKADLNLELQKLESRIKMASEHVLSPTDIDQLKHFGDLILANTHSISAGQELLVTDDLFSPENGGKALEIKLNATLSAAQNAQHYYRQYAKSRARNSTASRSVEEARHRRATLEERLTQVARAQDLFELRQLKDQITGRKPQEIARPKVKAKKPDSRVLSVNSADGWTIYVGRNRNENDYLLSRLAQPNDLWFHVLGQGGAHVLIKIPSSKQEPPATTIQEAAQIAARLSKAASGAKIRVVYTQCKFVKKLAKDKPGLVKYEQEKTIEVDTSKPMPKSMKQLFSHQ